MVAVTLHASQSWIDEILSRFEPDVLQADLHDLGRLRLPQALHTLPVLRVAAGARAGGTAAIRGRKERQRSAGRLG